IETIAPLVTFERIVASLAFDQYRRVAAAKLVVPVTEDELNNFEIHEGRAVGKCVLRAWAREIDDQRNRCTEQAERHLVVARPAIEARLDLRSRDKVVVRRAHEGELVDTRVP